MTCILMVFNADFKRPAEMGVRQNNQKGYHLHSRARPQQPRACIALGGSVRERKSNVTLFILLYSFLSSNPSTTCFVTVSFPQKMIQEGSQAMCWSHRHLSHGTHGNENPHVVIPKWAGRDVPSSCRRHHTTLALAVPPPRRLVFYSGSTEIGKIFFTRQRCFLFPKAKKTSNEMPPFSSRFFSSFSFSTSSSFSHPTSPSHFLCCSQHIMKSLLSPYLIISGQQKSITHCPIPPEAHLAKQGYTV